MPQNRLVEHGAADLAAVRHPLQCGGADLQVLNHPSQKADCASLCLVRVLTEPPQLVVINRGPNEYGHGNGAAFDLDRQELTLPLILAILSILLLSLRQLHVKAPG